MIITTTRHGRTAKDTKYLLAHLSRQDGQMSCVTHIAAPVSTEADALDYMQALRDSSRATVAFHHISLSPSTPLTNEQRDEAVTRVLAAMGAEDHAHVVWEHSEKMRRGRGVDNHYHIVVGHVGPDGQALDDGQSYVRLEAAARSLEFDFGHNQTASRRTEAVARELERIGRPDVAADVRNERPPEPPQSSMSSRQRARAERKGVSLSEVREAVRDAWVRSDTPMAFQAALAEAGYGIVPGDKADVWLVTRDSQTLGALDRFAGEKRRVVAARMQQEEPSNDRATPASDASLAGDIHGGPREPAGCGGVGPTACPPRPSRARRGLTSGGGHRASSDHRPYAATDAPGGRSIGCSPRPRARAALAALVLTYAARTPAVRKATRSFQRRFRPKGQDLLDARRLAQVDLDEFRRLAEEIGRRVAALLTRVTTRADDPRAVLRARLRAASAGVGHRRRVSPPFLDTEPEAPPATYRPRF